MGGPARDCDDAELCTTDSCNEDTDVCVHANNTLACDDGLFCTEQDVCSGGTCSGSARDCTDGNVCTDDACNELSDACEPLNNTTGCDDGVFCNGADTCSAGVCSQHPGDPCDGADGDGNCAETCDEGADNCAAEDPEASPCSDGNSCTIGDACDDGVCVPGEQEDPQCTTTTTTSTTTTTLEVTTTTTSTTTTTQEPPTTTTTVPEGPMCGDFDGNGKLTANDALEVLRTAVKLQTCELWICDYNGSDTISSIDALLVLRAAVDLPATPECPEPPASAVQP
jgi:hypothetical protein